MSKRCALFEPLHYLLGGVRPAEARTRQGSTPGKLSSSLKDGLFSPRSLASDPRCWRCASPVLSGQCLAAQVKVGAVSFDFKARCDAG